MEQGWLDLSCQRQILHVLERGSRANPALVGIWISPSSKSPPILTLLGSTNLNSRSAHLDTELSFLIILPSRNTIDDATRLSNNTIDTAVPFAPDRKFNAEEKMISASCLRGHLQSEVDNIWADTSTWKGYKRKVRLSTKLIVWLVKGML